jgi:hypothetical protein
MNKKVLLIEHVLFGVLLFTFVYSSLKKVFSYQRIRSQYAQILDNAYLPGVSFWGNNSFYTKEIPVETNGLFDVSVQLNRPVVYTTEVYSTNRQSRIVFEVRPVEPENLKYELSVVVYDFHPHMSDLGGKSIPSPMQFFINSNGVSSPGYKGFNGTSRTSFEGVDVYASIPPEQQKGTCAGYVYVNFPDSPFTREDGIAFCDSPATFPRDKLCGKVFRLVWNYESDIAIP